MRELAGRTGTSQTAAVREAVRLRLEQLGSGVDPVRERRRARAVRLVEEFRDALTDQDRERLRGAQDDLYDERGLPR